MIAHHCSLLFHVFQATWKEFIISHCLAHAEWPIYTMYSDMFLSLFPYHLVLDTQTLEQSAQNCTPEQVGQFLEGIGLGHHMTTFIEQDVSGEMLLEANQEVLVELGVTSAIERHKIKVH